MKKSGASPVSMLSDWEAQLDQLLQVNNDRLIEKLQQSFGRRSVADRLLSNMTTDSTMDPYNRISTGTVLGPVGTINARDTTRTVASVQEDEVAVEQPTSAISSRMSSKDKNRRLSMTSMTSEEETQHVERLKTTQMERNHGVPRGSTISSVSKENFLSFVRKVVESWAFEAFYAFAILSNSVCIGVEVHYAAHNREMPLPAAFFLVDQAYAALFFIELAMRILAEGKPFFWTSPNVAWNYLDILINITSVLNLATFVVGLDQDVTSDTFKASGNMRIIRILRLTRVIRVVRIVKIVRFIRALRSLVHSIFGTLKVLLWSVLLLLMIMYVFAIIFTDVSNEYNNGFQEVSDAQLIFLQKYFFDLERSIFTLFESICNGLNWGEIADMLNSLSRVWGYLYVIFIAFCLFAVLNVMTGMFCQSAIESAERDQELHIQNAMNNKQQQVEMFMSIFHMLQQDRGRRSEGNITFAEFEQLFHRDQVRNFFQALDVEAKDAWTLFKLMDVSGNGDLDASEFVDGCMRLKGPARSIDVSLLLQEQRRVRKKINGVEQLLLDFLDRTRSKRPSLLSVEEPEEVQV